MNARRLRKVALMLATPQAREVRLVRGLYERTGSVSMAVGFFRPRIVADPRLFGEHRTIQEMVRCHEGAHILLGHTRIASLAKWFGISLAVGFGVCAGFALTPALGVPLGVVCGWLEGTFGFTTLHLRAGQEREADEVALSVMRPHAFASAVKTLALVKPKMRGWPAYADRVLNGRDWRDRLARVGVEAS